MERIKPHWGWFFLGPAILVLGGVGAFELMVAGILSAGSDMQHVPVPGEGVVHINEAGDMTLFYEQFKVASATVPVGLNVQIRPVGGSATLPVGSTTSFTYSNGRLAGRSIGAVNFPEAGDYKVKVSVPEGVPADGNVALGGNPAGAILGTIFGFIGIGFASFVLCILVLVVVGVKRGKHRKRILQQQHAGFAPQAGMRPPPPGASAG
ncbi:MAG: hypothetical protein R3E76_04770 [Planctomycetota bacterium]